MNLKKIMITVAAIGAVAILLFYGQQNLWPMISGQKAGTAFARNDKAVIESGQTAANKKKYPLAPNDSPAIALIREYESSTDKRKFYDAARLQPEAGGAFLALKVAMECMLWVKSGNSNAQQMQKWIDETPKDSPHASEHIAAIKKLLEPCLGFDKSPVNMKEVAATAKAAQAIDPVLKTQKSIQEKYQPNGDLSAVSSVIADAIKSGNPYAIQSAFQAVGVATIDYKNVNNIVGGTELVPQDAKAFLDAMQLAACQFGVDCGPDSWPALSICVAGNCNMNLYQHIQSSMAPEQYANVMRYHTLIVDGLYRGDFDVIRVERRNFKK